MGSQKLLGIILVVIGIILLVFGFNASQSLGDQVTETFTGRFTDETMWYIIGGAVAVVVGGFLALGRK
ncbi:MULTISPECIES: DUF3185 family protein [unclassified Methylophaga]|jgi:uncharacterized membrane protein YidH (DUF202 family)|uniref:DUF3185 family protein n=1 Tax=unclassified Methylophaga TaxID=2629249 RepID=UPI000C104185|nr:MULTISPECIES: DUF3185 family protein [unclassified Methylophaga]MAP27641.1 hypothetical protein [Methylophaga sp.]MBL1458626.1 DUF3185 family protein [Methylophaga sp.]MDX1750211.1 DUF3185 family protein [Methylophaga sp.]HBX58733.1 hypothetical protein [Methylophaga sp.]HCO01682.1 hypothetical protein [Methylophaga sp.]|tara:strand:- start:195 stop:398 length:204 start_codon:yes stop_codon:yes gene_type:complete